MKSIHIEKYGPIFIGLASLVLWYFFGFGFSMVYAKELLAGFITASAIGAGFMATALSILLAMGGNSTAGQLINSPYKKLFFRYIRSCFYACLLLVAICLGAFIFIDSEKGLSILYTTIIVGAAAYTVSAFVRVTEILLNIFER